MFRPSLLLVAFLVPFLTPAAPAQLEWVRKDFPAGSGHQIVYDAARERLVLFGYKDSDADSYADIGYKIRSRHQFRVQEGFPRIVSSDLRTGVSDVTYSVAVTACAIFEVTEGELANLLRGDP